MISKTILTSKCENSKLVKVGKMGPIVRCMCREDDEQIDVNFQIFRLTEIS